MMAGDCSRGTYGGWPNDTHSKPGVLEMLQRVSRHDLCCGERVQGFGCEGCIIKSSYAFNNKENSDTNACYMCFKLNWVSQRRYK